MNYIISENDFEDDISKMIFKNKKLFYETGNWMYLLKMVADAHNHTVKKICKKADLISRVFIFGAGYMGDITFQCLRRNMLEKHIAGFIDNSEEKQKKRFNGKKVISVKKVVDMSQNSIVVIPEGRYANEMKQQLLNEKYPEEKIVSISDVILMYNAFLAYDKIVERDDLYDIFVSSENHFVIFGTSHREFLFAFLMQKCGLRLDYFCEEMVEEQGKTFHNVPVISVNQLSNDFVKYIVVFSSDRKQILLDMGISEEYIIQLANMDLWQYFDDELVLYANKEKESFIDGGSLNLDSAIGFMNWCNNNCDTIYSFEPDPANFKICEEKLNMNEKLRKHVTLIQKGLWSRNCTLTLKMVDVSGASFVSETECPNVKLHEFGIDSSVSLECTSIDEVLQGKKVTFIKMDIEGSELEALKGAKETIQKYHPTLSFINIS